MFTYRQLLLALFSNLNSVINTMINIQECTEPMYGENGPLDHYLYHASENIRQAKELMKEAEEILKYNDYLDRNLES